MTRTVLAEAPGPRGSLLLGSLREITQDPLGLLTRASRDHGDVVRFQFGPPPRRRIAHLITDPEGVRHVLQHNHRNYVKAVTYEPLRHVLGEGLLTSEGETWRTHRQAMQPAFRHDRVQDLSGTVVRFAEETARRWERYAASGETVDVSREMMALTLKVIAASMFSASVADEVETIGRSLTVAMEWAVERMTLRGLAPPWFPTPRNRRLAEAVSTLHGVVDRLTVRRRDGAGSDDLLGLLLEARDQGVMTDAQVRDEVMTILLAGHETTANALTWTWHLLGRHPDVEGALHETLDARLGGRAPSPGELAELDLVRQVVDEAMRLYPPAWVVERNAVEDDAFAGFRLPAGGVVMLSPWVTHRSPRYWRRPEVFDPERFAGGGEGASSFRFFPFGGGPRRCIGEHFALLEAHLVLAILAGRFRVRPLVRDVVPEPLVTLRPRGGLPARIEARTPARRRAPLGTAPRA